MTQLKANRRVTVNNEEGLHARPAELFVRRAGQFEAKIQIIKGGERVDGKSILEILTLAAAKGTTLEIEAIGADADVALETLAKLIETGFAVAKSKNQEQSG